MKKFTNKINIITTFFFKWRYFLININILGIWSIKRLDLLKTFFYKIKNTSLNTIFTLSKSSLFPITIILFSFFFIKKKIISLPGFKKAFLIKKLKKIGNSRSAKFSSYFVINLSFYFKNFIPALNNIFGRIYI